MIKNFNKVRIVNTKVRRAEGVVMKKLLERKNENVDVSIALDPIGWGAWKTYRIAMDIKDDADWLILMEDDISFPVDVLQRMDFILNSAPKDAWVFFYVPTNKGTRNAFASGKHVMSGKYNWWPQATAIPLKHRQLLLDEIDDVWHKDSTSGDGRIKKYIHLTNGKALTILPSLFQHLGTWRSSLGYNGKVGKYVRQSFCYEPEFDVYSVDWKEEFKNPYIDKSPKGIIGFENWKAGDSIEGYNDGGIKKK